MVKFLLLLFIACVVKGFPEGQREGALSPPEKIEAIPAFRSTRFADLNKILAELTNQERWVSCPDPNFDCDYNYPVCVCGGNCCPLHQPNFYAGYCYAVDY